MSYEVIELSKFYSYFSQESLITDTIILLFTISGLARLQTVPGLNALSEAKEETPPPVVVQIKDKDDDQIDDGDSDDDSLGMLDIFG